MGERAGWTAHSCCCFTDPGDQGTSASSQVYLKYRDISKVDRGVLSEILARSYQPLKDMDEFPWIPGDTAAAPCGEAIIS